MYLLGLPLSGLELGILKGTHFKPIKQRHQSHSIYNKYRTEEYLEISDNSRALRPSHRRHTPTASFRAPCTAKHWNALPHHIIEAPTLIKISLNQGSATISRTPPT